MKEPYIIFEDKDEGSLILCREVEKDGSLTLVHGVAATHIRDMPTASLLAAAPALLEACETALVALNTAPRFRVPALDTSEGKIDSYKVASRLGKVIALAKGES